MLICLTLRSSISFLILSAFMALRNNWRQVYLNLKKKIASDVYMYIVKCRLRNQPRIAKLLQSLQQSLNRGRVK